MVEWASDLVYRLKRIGPRTEPRGTPVVRQQGSDRDHTQGTLWIQSVRCVMDRKRAEPETPSCARSSQRRRWFTVSVCWEVLQNDRGGETLSGLPWIQTGEGPEGCSGEGMQQRVRKRGRQRIVTSVLKGVSRPKGSPRVPPGRAPIGCLHPYIYIHLYVLIIQFDSFQPNVAFAALQAVFNSD